MIVFVIILPEMGEIYAINEICEVNKPAKIGHFKSAIRQEKSTNQKVGGSNPSGATMNSQSARFALRIFYFK